MNSHEGENYATYLLLTMTCQLTDRVLCSLRANSTALTDGKFSCPTDYLESWRIVTPSSA